MPPRKHRTNGTERAFQILECLIELGESATAYQIAKHIGAPLSTIYESIALLERLEVLRRCGGDGKYFLGSRLLFYGLSYIGSMAEDEIYRHEADSLCHACGENVQICIRDGDCMVVAAMVEPGDHFHISSRPGSRTPLNWSASGRLLIGHLSPGERVEIFSLAKPSATGRALTDPDALEAACREAWEQGYSVQIAESDFAVACIAAPVKNAGGECVAAISLVVPETTAKDRGEQLSRLVMASARNIEKQLGWQPAVWKKREAAS
ncbi:MAG: IclR family transcriptional regulator [Planctomycetota bacterium]|jgi:DNA-binding IclR family transcriptional regulator|nr:IclR family transcriptional regulator [Planctomycetota bacterium]